MRHALRIVLAMAVGFGMTIAAVEVSDQVSAQARGTRLGSLDFYRYCAKEYGATSGPVNPSNSPTGWYCTVASNPVFEVDPDEACASLYSRPAYSQKDSVSGPFGWNCYRGPRPT